MNRITCKIFITFWTKRWLNQYYKNWKCPFFTPHCWKSFTTILIVHIHSTHILIIYWKRSWHRYLFFSFFFLRIASSSLQRTYSCCSRKYRYFFGVHQCDVGQSTIFVMLDDVRSFLSSSFFSFILSFLTTSVACRPIFWRCINKSGQVK